MMGASSWSVDLRRLHVNTFGPLQAVQMHTCVPVTLFQDPVIKIPFNKINQNVCTYKSVYYKTYELPGCPPGVDPMVTYPVALSCHCSRCSMNTSDCTFQSLQPDFCVNDVPFYYYS